MITNKYQFWFEADGGKTRLQLPVNPEKITVKNSAKNESFNAADFGEITILKEKSLEQISFSGIFPAHYFPGCAVKKPLSRYVYTRFFAGCMMKKNPVRLVATQCGLVKYVTIEDFTYSESGGDVGTLEYSLTLKEYRSTKVRQIKLESGSKNKNGADKKNVVNIHTLDKKVIAKAFMNQKKASRVSTKTPPETYTVKSGDCLFNLAKKFYGDGSKFTKIYEANKKIIGSNPNKIKEGQVFTIPN